jgi:hypothetical protein
LLEAYFFPPPARSQVKDSDVKDSKAKHSKAKHSKTKESKAPQTSKLNQRHIRNGIYDEAWYPMLLVLWYILALAVGSDLLYSFAYLGAYNLDPEDFLNFVRILRQYAIWMSVDVAILWIPTLFLIDPIIQGFWHNKPIGQWLENKPWAMTAFTVLIAALVFGSVWIDVLSYRNSNI